MTARISIAFALIPLLLSAGAASAQPAAKAHASLGKLADAFVPLALETGTHDKEYVDAYFGPPERRKAAEARPRSRAALEGAARKAVATLDRDVIPKLKDSRDISRARALRGFYLAAATRLAMAGGKRYAFDVEAQNLFGVTPTLKPLSYYDGVLARLDKLVPGEGPLAARVDAYNERFVIPTDRLRPVMEAAIAECRKRTVAHFDLPADERFSLAFATNKPWSGYNYYQGGYHSLIEINTDLPVRIGRAVDLGCHEGYPGHHVLNIMVERELVGARGWKEYEVNPLYGPQSLISEGSANYGISLAFPGDEQLGFERDVLFPLAGLDPSQAEALWAVRRATEELGSSRQIIGRMYLNGEIDKAKALPLLQNYQLVSAERAAQSLGFIEHYRSYVINYHFGRDLVRDNVERGNPDAATRWARMRHILSDGVIPADLLER